MQESLTYDVPLVSARYAARFLKFLSSKGISRAAIQAHHPMTELQVDNPDSYLSMNQIIPALETAQWLLRDEKAAFEFGQQLDLDAHGLFGYMLLSRENQSQLIETVVKHIRICLPLFDMEVLHSGRDAVIRLRDTWDIGVTRSFMAKIYMGSIYAVASKICLNMRFDCNFESVIPDDEWLSLAPSTHWNFGAEHNQVTLPLIQRSDKTKKLKVVYSIAKNKHLNQPSDLQVNTESSGRIAEKIREHIMKRPGQVSIERSAELLSMSSRYLRQQLAEEGTSFREISNEIRKSFAELYLRETPMPLVDIASKLGFGDQASFTRAYRGWTGKTPGEVRREAKKAPSI
ncbi:MAG: helix-turn-helix domain-containing protein [Hahellaceae bacterium]|nr:helix-turn-helix domain-containing protein [Hahellaceae bacterium]MCP5212632.1 helix-turn-helix domain-containing protein [Hahellaceae bacterium]